MEQELVVAQPSVHRLGRDRDAEPASTVELGGARAQIAGPLSVRGGASTGFRAPSLQQLWFSNVSTQFIDQGMGLVATSVLTSNNQSPVTKAFGIPSLHEERSNNASGGITLKSGSNLSFSADGYFIRLKDRIVLTSQFSAPANDIVKDILSPFAGVSAAQFFANAVDTDTKGLDLAESDLEFLLTVDKEVWRDEASLIPQHLNTFGDHTPKELWDEYRALVERLG